jgi:uncharacterized repeat protein (TIGR02543 family)
VSELVEPDATGKITLTMSRVAGMSHINVIKLEEVTTVPTEYSITYETNGGTAIPDGSYTVISEAVILPTPVKTGYTFAGWYANEEFTGIAVTAILKGSAGDKTFYAKWTVTNFSITYISNGGTAIVGGSYTIEDTVATVLPTATAVTRTGYTFAGWFNNAELTGVAVTAIPKGSDGNKTFWAKWTATEYTITYVLDGGTIAGAAPDKYTIESDSITLPIPTKAGFDFGGWFTSNRFLENTRVTGIGSGSTDNLTVYAQWLTPGGLNSANISELNLYPNPITGDEVTVDNIQSATGKIEIYSVLGALVSVHSITGTSTVINVSALPAGAYIVKADGKKAIMVKK